MNLVKVISSTISSLRQSVKFLRYGKSDVQETPTVAPYGVDSNPIADMIGLYAETGEKGKNVLIGYINKRAIAQPGETRFFSTDSDGAEKAFLYFKNDGFIHFNGDEDNLARFSYLKKGHNDLRTELNTLIDNWNAWCNVYVPGGPTVVGSPLTAVSLITPNAVASIDDAKIDKLLTSLDD